MGGLKQSEVHWVVNSYIGVADGYLGDFSYRTHREFYPAYCDLNINPGTVPGTTRERFLRILGSADSRSQAAILRGVAKKYPTGSAVFRTAAAGYELSKLISRCAGDAAVEATDLKITSDLVQRALSDAAALMTSSGPTSAIDRVHTALHGYLKAACSTASIQLPPDASMTELFKLLRQGHPRLRDLGEHDESIVKVLRALTSIMDAMNPARNRGSLAHPNDQLLDEQGAILFINAARTVLQYLDARLSVPTAS
jgi:hypothetical protein